MLFVWHGSVLTEILPRLVALLLLSSLIVYLRGQLFEYKILLNSAPFTLTGMELAIFLGFRNNASYDRICEGCKLLGHLLIFIPNLNLAKH